jgi:hypothetical protein
MKNNRGRTDLIMFRGEGWKRNWKGMEEELEGDVNVLVLFLITSIDEL